MKRKISKVFILSALLVSSYLTSWAVFPNDWQYSRELTITNSTSALTNYQVFVPTSQINTSALISQGKMLANLNDVRFTDNDHITLLNYWIDNSMGNVSGFWVKVSSIPAQTTKNIYIYYGNTSASAASNGPSTFDFFDDFDSYSNGSTGSPNWTTTVQWSIQNGVFSHSANGDTSQLHLASISGLSFDNFAINYKCRWDGGINDNINCVFRSNINPHINSYGFVLGEWGNTYSITKINGNYWSAYAHYATMPYTPNQGSWINVTGEAVERNLKVSFGNSLLSGVDIDPAFYSSGYISFCSIHSSNWSLDDVHVRKLIYPEPNVVLSQANQGIVFGKITNSDNVSPIYGSIVQFYQNNNLINQTTTNATGNYSISVNTGTYWIFVSSRGYIGSLNKNIVVNTGQNTTLNISLDNGDIGLVGYWPLNEGSGGIAFDFSGNENKGSILGPTSTSGVSNNALNFDGSNDYVRISDSQILDITNGITLEAWVNVEYSFNPTDIISKHGSSAGTSDCYFLQFYQQKPRLGLYNNSSQDILLAAPNALSLNEWHHVAATWDGTTAKIYVDGILVNSTPLSGTLKTSNLPVGIGRNGGDGWSEFFDGSIDEARIYNYALTAQQIQQHVGTYSGTLSGKITKSDNTSPLYGAKIEVYQNDTLINQTNTNSSGDYSITVNTGTYWIFVSSRGYVGSLNKNIVVNIGQNTTLNVSLNNGDIGLVGYWSMNEGSGAIAYDYSGNNSSGIVHGATWSDTAKGKSLSFDGVNDYVDILNESNFDFEWNQPITIEAWLNLLSTNNPTNLKSIFSKQYNTVSPYTGYQLYLYSRDSSEININYSEYNNYQITDKRFTAYSDSDYGAYKNEWHHITMTYDGSGYAGNVKYYLDGLLVVTKIANGVPNESYCTSSILNNLKPNIGARENGSTAFYNGFINNFKIFNYVRTAGQILADAGTSTAPNMVRDGTGTDIDVINAMDPITQLSANWDASTDANYGISKYWYAIGTTPGATNTLIWTDNSTATSVTKTGLTLTIGTTYYVSVKAENGIGLQSAVTSSDGQLVLNNNLDTTPPVITNVTTTNISQTGATITWDTDEPSSSQIEYGLTTSYGMSTSDDLNLLTNHTISLSGLNPGTTFHYRVLSIDATGNQNISGDYAFSTLPVIQNPVVIININVINITINSVTIVWITDNPSTSQIEYGQGQTYASVTTINATLVTTHTVTISNLSSDLEYHYRIRSKNSSNVETISDDNTFTISPATITDNKPSITITYPGKRQTIEGNLIVKTEASDDKGVTKVEFFVDGVKKNIRETSPYNWTWDTTLEAQGEHVLKAIVYDSLGQTSSDELTAIIHQKPKEVNIKGELKPIDPVSRPGSGKKAIMKYSVDVPEDVKQTGGQKTTVHVKITIHTLRGTLVKTIVDEEMPVGSHETVWDGTNFAEEVAASGVYIVKLQAGDFRDMKKIVVVK